MVIKLRHFLLNTLLHSLLARLRSAWGVRRRDPGLSEHFQTSFAVSTEGFWVPEVVSSTSWTHDSLPADLVHSSQVESKVETLAKAFLAERAAIHLQADKNSDLKTTIFSLVLLILQLPPWCAASPGAATSSPTCSASSCSSSPPTWSRSRSASWTPAWPRPPCSRRSSCSG